jgi:dipeptidyl aminopeptidase/acylaminoacyl peptidase
VRRLNGILILFLGLSMSSAAADKPFDAAAAFGARPVSNVRLSPDGTSIAFISPLKGPGSALYTLSLEAGAKTRVALTSDGKPARLGSCDWVSNTRLACKIYGVVDQGAIIGLLPFTRVVAVDDDGRNLKLLSTRTNENTRGFELGGGTLIDALPEEDGVVLMTRVYLPDDHTGSRLGSTQEGLGVDRIDTRTLAVVQVEPPHLGALQYLTDGHGTVRIMALRVISNSRGQDSGVTTFMYRTVGSRDWQKLSDFNREDGSGFLPLAVDATHNVAYGLKKADGKRAIYSMALDGTLHEELIYQRPDVDVGGLVRIGRRQRPVGVHYDEEKGYVHYFDADIEHMHTAMAKALPALPNLNIVDSSTDESKLLIYASSGSNPGTYYLFDRNKRELRILLAVQDELLDVSLGSVEPIQYPAADGTLIPGYLTLPPGEKDPKNLPAVVLPHGGPAARDNWQFNWLAQFFAARGYAVLQPNFRGSSGYGDAWFQENGFKSWPIAVGDVLDAGRWLVARGIADPARLAVVGWSYGGYAALQSAVMDPKVFKAVVAIAPVTDLDALKEEHRHWSDFELVSRYVGEGPHVREGSPIENASRIKVPVILFHGAYDINVGILESKRMAARLTSAGVHCELVTWDDLDHQLEDSQARTQMLHQSDAFLRQALGM